jgi:hypothetical protein
MAALAVLLAVPSLSLGQNVLEGVLGKTQDESQSVLHRAQGAGDSLAAKLERKRRHRRAAPARRSGTTHSLRPRATATDPGTQPPLHGTNPHAQGTDAAVDLTPSADRPLGGDPSGSQSGEDIVVGSSRGEQNADKTYHGHITVAALFGNDVVAVDTTPGQSKSGPLDAVQTGLLDALCNGSGNQICLTVLQADSSTSSTGTTQKFKTAHATLGTTQGIDAGAAESNSTISDNGTCQAAHSDSTVTDANVGGAALADVTKSTNDSQACKNQTPTQSNTSSVIGLGGTGVPLPAPGCADGTPDTVTGIPTVAPIICNADDTAFGQVLAPYGVREALSVFALQTGTSALLKAVTAASEGHAVAPPPQCSDTRDNDGDGRIDYPADPGCSSSSDDNEADNPQCSDGRDNDGDGKIDYPADPGCSSATDNSEANARPACSDGRDNDGDGRIDYPDDPGCSSRSDTTEGGENQCHDGKDNDGDGLTDGNDPDCQKGNRTSEFECSNGVDDDGDGKTDYPDDPQCSSRQDDSEAGAGAPQCSDGIDNDGDGKIDFPNDPGCASAADDSEADNLPFTGGNVLLMILLGGAVLSGGAGLRRLTRSGSSA